MGGRCHRNRDHLMRWLHLRLHAPLGAFGGESVDARGVIRDFPAQSMMTGLIANALGWSRTMTEEHQALQDRIVFGALWEDDVPLGRLTDYQTGSLNKDDQAWTTRGAPARRAGGPGTYEGSHQRWRDYHSDLRLARKSHQGGRHGIRIHVKGNGIKTLPRTKERIPCTHSVIRPI